MTIRDHLCPSLDLIIFDCDGVLVDSETITNNVLLQLVEPYGFRMPRHEADALLTGYSLERDILDIEQYTGRKLPENFSSKFKDAECAAFERELQPIAGIEAALDQITLPMCVASGGPREKIELTLDITGLLHWFKNKIFSAYEVGAFKPDPGLFLAAAAAHHIQPNNCVVVEDSLPGVQAGIAAGMQVLAFTQFGDHQDFEALGARVFDDMAELPLLLARTG